MRDYLNTAAVTLIDLRYKAKNAHWNCKGFLFYEYHLLFDRIYNEYEDLIDRLAERFMGMSRTNKVTGSTQEVSKNSKLPAQGDCKFATDFARDLLSQIIASLLIINDCLKQAESEDDQGSLNVLAEVQELLDNHKFLLGSSLET